MTSCPLFFIFSFLCADVNTFPWTGPQDTIVPAHSSAVLSCHRRLSSSTTDFDELRITTTWYKENRSIIEDKDFVVLPSGDLHIKNVTNTRPILFRCEAEVRLRNVSQVYRSPPAQLRAVSRQTCLDCQLQPTPGPCGGHMLYFFDSARQRCQQLPRDRCGRASKDLSTLSQCNQHCASPCRVRTWCGLGNVVRREGDLLDLHCVGSAVDQPTLGWSIDRNPAEIMKVASSRLEISNLKPHHSGLYTCSASTAIASQPCTVRLTVLENLTANIEPRHSLITPGSFHIINCSVTMIAQQSPVEFTWTYNGRPLNDSFNSQIRAMPTYSAINVSYSQRGLFQCRVARIVGHDQISLTASVQCEYTV